MTTFVRCPSCDDRSLVATQSRGVGRTNVNAANRGRPAGRRISPILAGRVRINNCAAAVLSGCNTENSRKSAETVVVVHYRREVITHDPASRHYLGSVRRTTRWSTAHGVETCLLTANWSAMSFVRKRTVSAVFYSPNQFVGPVSHAVWPTSHQLRTAWKLRHFSRHRAVRRRFRKYWKFDQFAKHCAHWGCQLSSLYKRIQPGLGGRRSSLVPVAAELTVATASSAACPS